jgi:hypothetical protein
MLRPLGGNGSSRRPRRGVAGLVSFSDTLSLISQPALAPAALLEDVMNAEKFMDPMYLVFGKRPYDVGPPPRWGYIGMGLPYLLNRYSMDAEQPDVLIGYEYLSTVANNAEARITALRDLINYREATGSVSSSNIVQSYIDVSRARLSEIADKLAMSYKAAKENAAAAAKVAEQLGVSSSVLLKEATEFAGSYGADYEMIAAAAKKYGPMAQAIISGIQKGIDITGPSEGELDRTTKVFDAAAEVAMYIPGYGPFIAAGINVMNGALKGELEKNKGACLANQALITQVMTNAMSGKYPVPFHGMQIFSLNCGEDFSDTEDQRSLINLFNNSINRFSAMPAHLRIEVQRWWGLALTYMSDPRVSEVFDNLGFDAGGGIIASDEQVMLVAAPIAVSYGIDVDTFAVALWKAAKGWRGVADAYSKEVRSFCPDAEGGCAIPVNGWWLQWADLSATAFKLAEGWRPKTPLIKLIKVGVGREVISPVDDLAWSEPGSEPGSEPTSEPGTSALVTVGLPAAAGIAAGFAFGGPIGIAVGVGAFLLSSILGSASKSG